MIVNLFILLVSHPPKATNKNIICKLLNLSLVNFSVFEIHSFFERVFAFIFWLLGKLIDGSLNVLYLNVSVEGHVAHHNADILWCYQTIVVKIIHVKREPHF